MARLRAGFTLLELIFGLLISAILASLLYACLYQLQRTAQIADDLLSVDLRVLTLKNQLSRDLAGAFMLPTTDPDQKYFFGESAQGNLQLLTFITVNPLRTAIETNPKMVRVRYQVQPVPEQPDSFKVVRTESDQLAYSSLKNQRPYEVIDGVKALKVTYFMLDQAPPARQLDSAKGSLPSGVANRGATSEQAGAKDTAATKGTSEQARKSKQAKEQPTLVELLELKVTAQQAGEFKNLPVYLKLELELWDQPAHLNSTSYELDLPIYTHQPIQPIKDRAAANNGANSNSARNNSNGSASNSAQPKEQGHSAATGNSAEPKSS